MQCKHPSSPVAKKFKMQPLAGKFMLYIWDSQGPILETYLECGETVTSATYYGTLQRELKAAIRSKRRGRLLRACPVVAQCPYLYSGLYIGNPQKTEMETHGTSTHSPDLVPSDFHLL
jgi:hypothetical protein